LENRRTGCGCRIAICWAIAGPGLAKGVFDVLIYIIFSTIAKAIGLLRLVLIIQFLMSMALTFNLINTRNGIVRTIWQGINALLDPLLTPIRRVLPNASGIDFSPLILLLVLSLVGELISSIAMLGLGV
jgi:YggT family protein